MAEQGSVLGHEGLWVAAEGMNGFLACRGIGGECRRTFRVASTTGFLDLRPTHGMACALGRSRRPWSQTPIAVYRTSV